MVKPRGTYTWWRWPAAAAGASSLAWDLTVLRDPGPTTYFWAHVVLPGWGGRLLRPPGARPPRRRQPGQAGRLLGVVGDRLRRQPRLPSWCGGLAVLDLPARLPVAARARLPAAGGPDPCRLVACVRRRPRRRRRDDRWQHPGAGNLGRPGPGRPWLGDVGGVLRRQRPRRSGRRGPGAPHPGAVRHPGRECSRRRRRPPALAGPRRVPARSRRPATPTGSAMARATTPASATTATGSSTRWASRLAPTPRESGSDVDGPPRAWTGRPGGVGASGRSVEAELHRRSGCASAGQGGRVGRQLGRGGGPDPVDQAGRREAAVDRDLDPEPVEQGGDAPGGAVRVGAGELARRDALRGSPWPGSASSAGRAGATPRPARGCAAPAPRRRSRAATPPTTRRG